MAETNKTERKVVVKELRCSTQLFTEIVTHLTKQPYVQVAGLIEKMKAGFIPVVPADVRADLAPKGEEKETK